jgi:hypothetical protein
LIEHGTHWISFVILTFISEKNKYSKGLYKIWNKINSFDMRKKMKCKTSHKKSEEKDEFESFSSESLGLKCGTTIMLGL